MHKELRIQMLKAQRFVDKGGVTKVSETKVQYIGFIELEKYKLIFEEVTQSKSLPKSSVTEKVEELKV